MIPPTEDIVKLCFPIFAERQRRLDRDMLLPCYGVLRRAPRELQDQLLPHFFSVCYHSKDAEVAQQLWTFVTASDDGKGQSRISDQVWFTYMKTVDGKAIVQSWLERKKSINLAEIPEAFVDFIARAASREVR